MFRTCTLVIIMDSINVMAVITFHSLYYIHFASIFFSIWHTQAQIPGSATGSSPTTTACGVGLLRCTAETRDPGARVLGFGGKDSSA